MHAPQYGDNIFLVGAFVSATLRAAAWPRDRIDEILREISAAESYDKAIDICRRYITIKDKGTVRN
jgi:hypothetical protein